MRLSTYLMPTLKEIPKDAQMVSHKLLIRAGMMRRLSGGIYSYLPLGWRVFTNIAKIIRDEMNKIGGQELRMPMVHPARLWQETGRWYVVGSELTRFKDRKNRDMVLGITHEEVITDIVRSCINSYRQLPMMLYQIQTKFRDEPRPRGGLIRAREFAMKDAYSFHTTKEDLDEYYPKVRQAYLNIFHRCGLDPIEVEADPGIMGGSDSHEFMQLNEDGEDSLAKCTNCGYAANLDNAKAGDYKQDSEEEKEVEEIATPGMWSIEAVARYLAIPQRKTAKVVFYKSAGELIFALVRGDLDVNEGKLARVLGSSDFKAASEEDIEEVGAVPGYASPIGLADKVKVIVDRSIAQSTNLVAGANKKDYHLKNVNYPRDFKADEIVDIAMVRDGDSCPQCGGDLEVLSSIELGHIFKLGTKYSKSLEANFLDQDRQEYPILMGCYGIGLGRLMAAVVEKHHDEQGIIWPRALAPFQYIILVLNVDDQKQRRLGDKIFQELKAREVDCLYDDRDVSAGVKFNDAELVGIPFQIVIGPQGMENNEIEVQRRGYSSKLTVPIGEEINEIIEKLKAFSLDTQFLPSQSNF